MRDILDQDRPMTLGAVKLATAILGLALLMAALFVLFGALMALFNGHVIMALTRMAFGFALIIFLFVTVRLLGEILAALHRLNDRLAILGDDIRNLRHPAPPPPEKAGE
ncbi:MAG: hypothetical protein KJ871_14260 [Alphaproteobacteria bacterium]|nr:hypothetical protein [Alphaproteobacteria bacterium]MBU2084989.1 hypothetical protein [Alphaproteobacteria bacterium]MBU2143933.1 hypothetical protein [Alphaproteobacteria bacterium]MBU2198048.1 hypothetical protein [Alphaproteobacteria bacterium]